MIDLLDTNTCIRYINLHSTGKNAIIYGENASGKSFSHSTPWPWW
jgi:hypothetical protein